VSVTARSANGVILALAAEQHGLVTRMQLQLAGVARHLIEWRVKAGLLQPMHAGVYRVGPVVAPRARELAAVLACPGAAASHRSAAALWQVLPPQPEADPVHVTVSPAHHCGRRPGIVSHRSSMAADEIDRLDGVPLTSPARTILDLSGVVSPRELEQALAHAERDGLARPADMKLLLVRYRRRSGTRQLRQLLERDTPPLLTRSEAEERLLTLIRKASLPEPETNVSLHGVEVDCFWRQARLAVEVDGYAYHNSVRAFVRDRQRDSALAAAGVQVLHLSWHQIEREREKTLVQLAQALARGRA